ncbi:MAG: 6-bladed beta-propeller [Melioribacteraceae bacterium]|nr:6-bladed beta-propeller [Melioribacteraceae bacterium]MCF8355402.1 6-bladed beta-propeller [Melioribacteraceae bacterium]MCF8394647.1 6-bladed beta-propeller [Melioribacteraceae bacterium]MCF8419644.1 6-bladed beta-propeller [Melioribacteraceae bacterium]
MSRLKIILIAILTFSCNNNSLDKTDNSLDTVIDTLGCMNSLFDIEKIPLNINEIKIPFGNIVYYTCDKDENIYLIDNDSEIFVFNIYGKFKRKYTNIGRGPGEYLSIERMAFDSYNNIYIDDWRQLSVKKYDLDFNFINEFKKDQAIPCVDMRIVEDRLFLLTPFASDNSICVYDINTFQKVEETGKVDALQKKFYTRLHSGSIIVDDCIYYSLPNYYQIHRIREYEKKEIIRDAPTHFVQVSERIQNPFKDLNKQSALFRIYKEGDYFFIVTSPAKGKIKFKAGYKFPTDIVNKKGEVLKEKLFFKNINSIPVNYDDKKYVSYGYNEIMNIESKGNEIKHYILLIKYKY